MHRLALLEGEIATLREANHQLSRRRRTKRTRLQDRVSLTIEEIRDLQAARDVGKQVDRKKRQGGRRTRRKETRARRCRACGKPGHNARTCQNNMKCLAN